jgi:3-oxoacyl-[acyl-carrier-protein] synthase-1
MTSGISAHGNTLDGRQDQHMYRVAITGIGIVSCLGTRVETVGEALRAGRSGIVLDHERQKLGFRSPLTGAIPGFDPHAILSRKQIKTMPEFAVQSYAAAVDALRMAKLADEEICNEETGLIFGCDSSCIAAIEQVDLLRERGETRLIGSGLVFRSMTSCITMNLNTLLKTRGACWTISSACSSGGHAVGQAADLIAMGRQERVICGGAQEINWESMCSFDALGAFSTRVDSPQSASRPFDAGRDGLVPSGGAAAVVLERYDLALARGAEILGEVTGYAFSSDGSHISVPSQDGLQRAMRKAIAQSKLVPADIDYVCAHATSTPAGDAAEAANISAVFGDDTPWVSSTKSMTGHELWMSGASQVVYSVIMARQGFIAPNANFVEPDEHSARLKIATEAVRKAPEHILCNSAGFGGTNSCLLLRFTR